MGCVHECHRPDDSSWHNTQRDHHSACRPDLQSCVVAWLDASNDRRWDYGVLRMRPYETVAGDDEENQSDRVEQHDEHPRLTGGAGGAAQATKKIISADAPNIFRLR